MRFSVRWSKAQKFEAGNFNVDGDGVYLIGYRVEGTKDRYPVYVGQGDIGTRLADHYRKNARINKRLDHPARIGYYRYAACSDEDDRLDVELGLYRKHGAEKLCNEIEPPGSGRYAIIDVEETYP